MKRCITNHLVVIIDNTKVTISIVTVNRNNATGLERTMQSVLAQTCVQFEYVVIDGASTDESVKIIRHYESLFGNRMKWVSEADGGIYNAMNKGIGMASGGYIEFLNSGDCFVSKDVISRVYEALVQKSYPSILYGNMCKEMEDGRVIRDKSFAGQTISFYDFYRGSLNHSSTFIRRSLFDKYGLYDETLSIVADWKWFLDIIVFKRETPSYVDLDVSRFDMHGISETNKELVNAEREKVLLELIPFNILVDYKKYSASISQMKRLKRHPFVYNMVWFLERCLFIVEKLMNKHSGRV